MLNKFSTSYVHIYVKCLHAQLSLDLWSSVDEHVSLVFFTCFFSFFAAIIILINPCNFYSSLN